MSAFSKDNCQRIACSNITPVSIADRLTMIEVAYQADDRQTCAAMIDDLYAVFDKLE